MTTAVLSQAVLGQLALGNTTPSTPRQGRSSAILGQLILGQAVLGNTTSTTTGTLPVWAPALSAVGAHIPTRTREIGVNNQYLGTFTTQTTPTAAQVTILLGHSCAWVEGKIGTPVMPAVHSLLAAATALRTAYYVELAYPERDADVAVYDRFLTDADALVDAAAAANVAAGGGSSLGSDGEAVALVAWSFPDPPRWADITLG